MPKKSRREKAKKRAKLARMARERGSQRAAPAVVAPAAAPDVPPKRKIPEAQDIAIRYQYVMPELRRIGILSGVMLLILFVLSFIVG